MSEARERLIEAGGNALWGNVLPGGEGDWGIDDTMDDAKSTLDAFLSRPDDLLAVLVEAQGRAWVMDALMKGVSDVGSPARLESDSDWLDTMTGTGNAPLHDPRRRTEGNTR